MKDYLLTLPGKDTSPFVNHIDSRDYIYLSVISLLGFISQLTLTKATQLINTTIVSLIRNTDILVTMVFQIFYFHDVPCWLQVLGLDTLKFNGSSVLMVQDKFLFSTKYTSFQTQYSGHECFPRFRFLCCFSNNDEKSIFLGLHGQWAPKQRLTNRE